MGGLRGIHNNMSVMLFEWHVNAYQFIDGWAQYMGRSQKELLLFCSSTWWPERQMTGNLPSYQSFRKFT
jgi:hypothetical protein